MSYKKIYPETSRKTVDVLAAKGALNVGCFVSGGELVPGINLTQRLSLFPNKAIAAWYMWSLKKHVLVTQAYVYYGTELASARSFSFSAKNPALVETGGQFAATCYVIGDTSYFSLSSVGRTKTFNGAVNSCIMKNGRIFGIDNTNPHKIKWSGEGGIDDWKESISGAGWVVVQYGYGQILNLIVYKDKIVAVRENGLTFLSAYGNPENFKLSYLERTLPKIYKNTVAVVGDNLVFYTEDGLYFFDGNKVEKCGVELTDDITSPTFASCAKGKYFLCGLSKTLNRKIILVFDVLLNAAYIIDLAVNAVGAGETIYAYSDNYEYSLNTGGAYTFTSGEFDFSSRKDKILKEIILEGPTRADIQVLCDGRWCEIERRRGKYRPNLRGKNFKIKIYSTEKISRLSAVAEVADGV